MGKKWGLTVLSWEKRLALEHLCEDTAGTPDVDSDVVFLPGEHDLRSSVVPRGDISRHLRILNPGEAKVADLQIAVLVHENIAGLEISVNYTSRVDVFQTSLHL